MNFRDPAIIVPGAAGAGFLFLPGRGLMLPAALFGLPQWQWVIPCNTSPVTWLACVRYHTASAMSDTEATFPIGDKLRR